MLAVAFEYAVIGSTIAVALQFGDPWLSALAVAVVGTRQFALAETLTHEAVHRNLCQTRWLNDLLGRLTTWPFFYVFSGYRRYHLEHHRVPLSDPENNIYEQYEAWGLPPPDQPMSQARAIWLFAVRPLLGLMAIHHIRTLLSNVYWDRDLRENTLMLGTWAVCVAIFLVLGWGAELLLFWILPQFLVIGTLDFWSETTDHYRVTGAVTRSHLGRGWNRLVARNIGLHALHHRFPWIPWYNLPAAHCALAGELEDQPCKGFFEAVRQMVDYCARPGVASRP